MSTIDQFRVKGRRALVTGSNRGIGRAILLALAEAGADVFVHGQSSGKEQQQTLAQARAFGVRAEAVASDMSTEAGVKQLVDTVQGAFGGLDILVQNVAVQLPKPWQEIPLDEADIQWRANYRSTLQLVQAFVPAMEARKWGRVLVIGSVQQAKPHPQMLVYSAIKSALQNSVESLARQVGPNGVTVNCLAPGVILTDRNEQRLADAVYREKVLSAIPTRTFGTPEDCAGAALLLCSEAGRYITGANLYVAGGMQL